MMLFNSPASRLSALCAACLLSVSLPALPASAKEKTKTKPAAETTQMDVTYDVSIPGIETVESNVEDAVLIDILSGNLLEHAEALAGLSATSITVPEISVTVTGTTDESYTASMTFSDLVLEDVTDGVAASVSLAATDMSTDEAQFGFGAISAAQVDIGGMLGIYGLVDGSDASELRTIYTDFSAEGGTVTGDEVDCTIGAVSGGEFRARPLQTSLLEFVALAEQIEEDDPEEVDPRLMGQMLKMYADVITAFETSEVSFDGLTCEGLDDEGRDMAFGLSGMTMGGMAPGLYPSISMDGLEITVEGDGSMSLDNFTLKPMDLTGVIETLETAPDSVDDAWFEANVRGLIPAMEGVSLSGFSIDIPDPENEDARIVADIGAFDLTLENYLNGFPTSTDMSADNIRAELPAGDESLDQLRALGVTEIDAGFRIAAAWDEATSTIDFEEVSVTGADLATVTLAATVANATAELFAIDPDANLAAGMALAVKSLDLSVVDEGLAEILLATVAAEQGGDPEQLRPIYADLAKGTVISMLAGVADAAKVGDAISAFIAGKATTLQIGLDAKEEPGLGLADFIAAETDPTSILRKVNIEATAK